MAKKINYAKNLRRDLLFIGLSIVLAMLLVRYGVLQSILSASQGYSIVSSFIAGFFFTSVFTIAPAAIAIAHIAQSVPILELCTWAALGSTMGDLIIFIFIKDVFAEDIRGAIKGSRFKRLLSKTHFGFLRWFGPLLGALIVISPLPDEMGLSLMGISRMKVRYLIPLAFVLNFIGVYLIASISLGLGV